MVVTFHPEIDGDLEDAIFYYSNEASRELAIEFYAEFLRCVEIIGLRGNAFPDHSFQLKRINFHRFPYHILFEIISEDVAQIVSVKHDRRHPSYGTDR
jgi:hypothetical protein